MAQLEYQRGLRKKLSKINPNVKLNKDAADLLNDLFNDLNTDLVTRCKKEFRAATKNKSDGITSQHAQQAVKKMFRAKLGTFATSEGQKAEEKFKKGTLKFNAAKAMIPDPREKKRQPNIFKLPSVPKPGAEFGKGLQQILSNINPGATFSIKGRTHLQGVMLGIAKKLVQHAVNNRRDVGTLELQDAVDAAQANLGQVMFAHGHALGGIRVDLYRKGQLTFRIVKKRPKETESFLAAQTVTTEKKVCVTQNRKQRIFVNPVNNMVAQMFPNYHVSKKGLLKADELLCRFFNKIAVAAMKEAIDENAKELTPQFFSVAIEKKVPPEMAKYCSADSQRALNLYHQGLIQFKPRAAKRPLASTGTTRKPPAKLRKVQKKQVVRLKQPASEPARAIAASNLKVKDPDFTSGIRRMVGEMNELASMNRSAADKINTYLVNLANRILEKTVEVGTKKNEVGVAEAQKAIEAIFPKSAVRECAISEGMKAIALSTMDNNDKTASKRKTQDEPAPAPAASKSKKRQSSLKIKKD